MLPCEIRFLHLTDTHVRADSPVIRGVNPALALQELPGCVSGSVDCVIHTGDLIHRPADETSYRSYAACTETLPWPVHHIPGNHDDVDLMASFVSGARSAYPWQVDVHSLRFIGLDSSSGVVDAAQLSRLSEMLETPGPVILCVHHHLFEIDDSWLNPYRLENAAELLACVDRAAASVLAILHGHTHYHDEVMYGPIPVLCAGACSAAFNPFGEFREKAPDLPSVTECRVHTDGRITRRRIFIPSAETPEGSP